MNIKQRVLSGGLVPLLVLAMTSCWRSPSDNSITQEIKARFYSDAGLKGESVEISVKNGEVTLAGEVSGESSRHQAFKLANDTPGVRKVNDQIRLREVQPAEETLASQSEPMPEPKKAPEPKAKTRQPKKAIAAQAPQAGPVPVAAVPPPVPRSNPIEEPQAPPGSRTAAATDPEPKPRQVTIPAGTTISVRMIDSIDSETSRLGEKYQASLDAPIVVDNEVIVPSGVDVFVKLIEVQSAGRLSGRSELRVALDRLLFQGKSYALETDIHEQAGSSRGKSTASRVGLGAAIGSAIGAITGGGKGAAIGGGIGAGSGTAVQVLTKGEQIRIPSEARLAFRLDQPLEVSLLPSQNNHSPSRPLPLAKRPRLNG